MDTVYINLFRITNGYLYSHFLKHTFDSYDYLFFKLGWDYTVDWTVAST